MSTPATTQQPLQFTFATQAVRIHLDETGEPWFCAPDVCDVLGYANSRDTLAKHCRAGGVAKRDTPTASGVQPLTFINEGNLFRLILKSRKPQAQKFEEVVCDEILPQIRKTGRYEAQPAPATSLGEAGKWVVSQYGDHINRYLYRSKSSVSQRLRQIVMQRYDYPPAEVPTARLPELMADLERFSEDAYQLWAVFNLLEHMLMECWKNAEAPALPPAITQMMAQIEVPRGPETSTAQIRRQMQVMLPGAKP